MKRRLIKRCAFLLAAVMTLETAFTPAMTEASVDVAVQTVDTGSGVEETETAVSDNTAEAVSDNSVLPVDDGSVPDNTAEELLEETLFQFLYLQEEYIQSPGTQYFLMGIGDENTAIDAAELSIKNLYTEEIFSLGAEEISEGIAVFSKEFADPKERAVYQAVSAAYTVAGEKTELDFSEIGVEAYFGVNEEFHLTGEETEIDLSEVEASIVTTDGLEVTTTADQIGEALMEAESGAVKDGVMANDMLGMSRSKAVTPQRANGNVVIVLDPGHDATHAGAAGNGLREEDLNLRIATFCKEELETYDGVVVYMTRTGAGCPFPGTTSVDDNLKRVQWARSVGATAYVSIHINASTSSASNGATVYYPNSNYNASVGANGKNLASKIQAKLAALGLKNNGIQIRNSGDGTTYPDGSLADYYGVIRNSKLNGFPGIIIEHAFISNSSDAANYLSSDDKLNKLGVADATGIAEYFGLTKSADPGTVGITEVNLAAGTFRASIGGLDSGKTIRFRVYPVGDANQITWYNAAYKSNKYTTVVDVKYHNYKSGTYMVQAYEIDKKGTQTRLAQKKVDFNEPSYGDVKVSASPTSDSKKAYQLKTSSVADAASVAFEIYNNADKAGTKQMIAASRAADGTWSADFDVSKTKLGGTYTVTAYATSCFKTQKKLAQTTFKVPAPSMGKLKLTSQDNKKGTFVLTVPDVSADAGVKNVTVEVWTKADKSDLYVYKAKKSGRDYVVNGSIKNHDYNYGTYKTRVTVTAKNGISNISQIKKVSIKQPVANIKATLSSSQTYTTLVADNVVTAGTVKAVKFVVCSKAGKKKDGVTYQAVKVSSGKWKAKVKNADIGQKGTYYVTMYAMSDKSATYKKVGTTTYEVAGPEIASAVITNKNTSKGTFSVTSAGVKCKGGISNVTVSVWSKSSKSDMVTYKAKKKGSKYVANVKIGDLGGKAGTYKVAVTATSKAGISYTTNTMKVKMTTSVSASGYPIMGDTTVTVAQMMAYYKANATYPSFYENTDAPTLKKFCELYVSECKAEGVRAEVAFVQAMKETNFLRFGGDVSISQFNFAGLGATGGGVAGASFANVKTGIRAQVQHLKAYACADPLVNSCVDSRFTYVTRGCAPYVEWLGICENPNGKGWATDPGYGIDIVKRINKLKTY